MNKDLKVLIVDDEPKARRVLQAILENHCEGVEVIGLAADVPEAVKQVNKLHPDLVLLDIEMPGYSGFELLDFFEKIDFKIVFVTAYSEYAIRAFQVSAVDYLLKPVEITALKGALDKVRVANDSTSVSAQMKALKENLNPSGAIRKIALPTGTGMLFVEPEDIIYLQADGSYTNVYLKDNKKLLVSRKLKTFDPLMNHPSFYKTHRSFVVNIDHIKEYIRADGGYLVMSNGSQASIARDRKEDFLKTIGAL